MDLSREGELPVRVQQDFDRLSAQLREHLEDLTAADRFTGEPERLNAIAGMAIKFFNFIGDIDHATSTNAMGGTEVVQNYAEQGVIDARRFTAQSIVEASSSQKPPTLRTRLGRFLAD